MLVRMDLGVIIGVSARLISDHHCLQNLKILSGCKEVELLLGCVSTTTIIAGNIHFSHLHFKPLVFGLKV